MSEDFESGLRELYRAAGAHADGSGLPTAALVGRVRRNRRIRTAAISAATTVAVVGIAWAGTAMAGLGDPAPLPPAEQTATATATARPSDAGTYTGPACGTEIGDTPVFDEPSFVVELTFDHDTVDPTEALSGQVVLAVADELDITFHPDGMLEGLDYTAVQDGVVVGYGRGTLVDGTWQTLSGRQGVRAQVTVSIQPCSPGAETLAGGEYQLFASMVLYASLEWPDGVDVRELSGPWPFTVTDAPDAADSDFTLVINGETSGDAFDALVSGTIGVNAQNCVTIGDRILVALPGSSIDADGVLDIPGYDPVTSGDEARFGGGQEEIPWDEASTELQECAGNGTGTILVTAVSPAT